MPLSPEDLARLAARFGEDRAFFGWSVARYVESEKVSRAALARRLGTTAPTLDRVCLCLRPRPDDVAAGIRRIAAHHGVDAGVLAEIARRADVLDQLADRPASPPATVDGTLLAARTRRPTRRPKGDA